MGDVVDFNGLTTLDIPPERVLSGAIAAELLDVVVIGTKQDGDYYMATSSGDDKDNLWLLEQAKIMLLGDD